MCLHGDPGALVDVVGRVPRAIGVVGVQQRLVGACKGSR